MGVVKCQATIFSIKLFCHVVFELTLLLHWTFITLYISIKKDLTYVFVQLACCMYLTTRTVVNTVRTCRFSFKIVSQSTLCFKEHIRTLLLSIVIFSREEEKWSKWCTNIKVKYTGTHWGYSKYIQIQIVFTFIQRLEIQNFTKIHAITVVKVEIRLSDWGDLSMENQ